MCGARLAFLPWVVLLIVGRAWAFVTVDATAQPGQRIVATAAGVAVPAGVHVWIGMLADGFAPSSDLTAVRAQWTTFGTTLTRSLAGQPGRFSASLIAEAPEFSGKKMYLLIQQTTAGAAPDPVGANVEAWGLFSGDPAAWIFPDDAALPPANATVVTSSGATQAWAGTLTAGELRLSPPAVTPAAAYAAWAASIFPVGFDPASTSPSADPDEDGLINALECLFDSSPVQPGPLPLRTEVSPAQAGLRIAYPRRNSLPQNFEMVLTSPDLATWAPGDAARLTPQTSAGIRTVDIARRAEESRLFARLALPWLGE